MNEHKFTLTDAAANVGRTRETLKRALKAAGIHHRGPYSLPEIIKALTPDGRAAKARLTAADAELRELEVAETRRELVRMTAVERVLAESVTLPLRQALLSVPTTLAVRCNSEHPEIARTALTQWRDETLKLLREKLEVA